MSKLVALYARVSTRDQNPRLQIEAIEEYVANHGLSPTRWYVDQATGGNLERPQFQRLQADVFKGRVAVVVMWSLDRLARSLRDGVVVLADWCERGIRIVSITQQLDLNGAMGRMVAALLLGIAEMEREHIGERVKAGIAAAKKRGQKFGRAAWLSPKTSIDVAAVRRLKAEGVTMVAIAKQLGFSRAGIYAALKNR